MLIFVAKKWMAVRVELASGRGEDFELRPGREMVLPPATTFEQFGVAVDNAFARWDHAHLRMFRLADGTMVADDETTRENIASPFGPPETKTASLDTRMSSVLDMGDVFEYVFDFGDQWTHACRVEELVDPLETLGIVPQSPLPMWGWGTIPDQYGRESEEPEITIPGHSRAQFAEPFDRKAFRVAVSGNSVTDAAAAMNQVDIAPVLQQVGEGLMRLAVGADDEGRDALEPLMLGVHQRLTFRQAPGDDLLAEDLLAVLQGKPLAGDELPVDLEELFFMETLDGFDNLFVDMETGEVIWEFMTDPAHVGEDAAVDVDEGDWRTVSPVSNAWDDMADFAATVSDPRIRDALEDAMEGRGAFSRFRREVERAGLLDEWWSFADDRKYGYARLELDAVGVRPRMRVRPPSAH